MVPESRPFGVALGMCPANGLSVGEVFKFPSQIDDADAAATALRVLAVSFLTRACSDCEIELRYFLIKDPEENVIQVFQKLKN
jgi:hypothetical protein